MSTDRHGDEPHADHPRFDLGEEAARLSETLQGWWTARSAASAEAPGRGQEEWDHRHGGPGSSRTSCQVCPVCRALDLARAVQPELLEKVASAAETVAFLLREAATAREARGSEAPAPGEEAEDGEGAEDGEDGGDHEGGQTAWA